MKFLLLALFLSAQFIGAASNEYRLMVLPAWSDSACTSVPSFAPPASAEYSLVEGFERDALVATHKLDSCRTPACVVPAAQSKQFTWMLLLRQSLKDSTCVTKAELIDATSFKLLKSWDPPDSAGVWVLTADSLLRAYVRERQVGTLGIITEPAGALVAGLPQGPVSTPAVALTLPKGVYPLQLTLTGYNPIADTVTIQPGQAVERRFVFEHTQAYKDSVAEALRKARQDSLVQNAKQTPEGQLSSLFQRLLNIQVMGSPTIAVLPFQCSLDSAALKKLGYHPGTMAAEFGITQIRADKRFRVVERQQLDLILQEQALQQTGLVEGSTGIEAGKIHAAEYLVVGQVVVANGRQMFFAKLLDTKSGEIVSASAATTMSNQNEELYRTALGERASASGAIFRSLVAPGWGQFYTDHPGHGTVFSVLAAGSLGFLAYSTLNYLDKSDQVDKFKDHDPSTVVLGETPEEWAMRANLSVNKKNDAITQLNMAIGGVGLVWILNLVDAYYLGDASAKAIRTQYFSMSPIVLPGNFGLNATLSF